MMEKEKPGSTGPFFLPQCFESCRDIRRMIQQLVNSIRYLAQMIKLRFGEQLRQRHDVIIIVIESSLDLVEPSSIHTNGGSSGDEWQRSFQEISTFLKPVKTFFTFQVIFAKV